ncbi:MAG TPA: FGGY-family carbohydrate kinase [Galbitalea sp.]|jgi:sugar (pentulose or hexulose) kinase
MTTTDETLREAVAAGRAVLGIELGSTRIKACLVGDDPSLIIASGSHEWENELVDGLWTYSDESVWSGLQSAYADLVANVERRVGLAPTRIAAIGVSAMMHGYLVFDASGQLLTPFRTWRNTTTGDAAAELSDLFGVNIPLRWSIAHLHQAVRDGEAHVPEIRSMTTLAGYVHRRLTGRNALGVGDASGMFPIDPATGDFDTNLLARYDTLASGSGLPLPLRELLPQVLVAGQPAGELSAAGAALLDPRGRLAAGSSLCPPEGDAGTGMVATNAIAPRSGNVSAGTSIFAMVVLERPLRHAHPELDVVVTPAGIPVAMVHCNNGASEIAAWVAMFARFAESAGLALDSDAVYGTLFREALLGKPDAGGLFAYNQVAGEPIAGLEEGRPLFVRTPASQFTLANTMRAQLYGVFATLALGMRILSEEGVALDRMFAHGGMFRTAGVASRFLAAALDAPVSTSPTAGEGGAWGMAVLAAFAQSGGGSSLAEFLRERVFASAELTTVEPEQDDVAGFAEYLGRYSVGLDVVRAAITAF